MNIYTIHDSKAKAFMTPWFQANDQTAIRICKDTVNKPGHPFSTNAEDFSLFHIGEYDETTGKINPVNPIHVINLVTLRVVDDGQLNLPLTGEENEDS